MSLKLAAIFFCIPKEPLIMKRYQISISFNFGFTPYIEGEESVRLQNQAFG